MSPLLKAVDDYLSLRRRLGYKLKDSGTHLHDFVSFLERRGASHITTNLALRWAMLPANAQPAQWAARLRSVRIFAQHHSASDPGTEIPPLGLLPYRFRRKQPYIYSATEIRSLMTATRGLYSTTGLRPWTYSTLLGLLAVTGLRISEALGLNQDDVDLTQCVLTIRSTKFNKTRLVPVHPTTRDALRRYARRRDRAYPRPKTPSLFVSEWGTRLEQSCVSLTFYRLSRWVGLRGPTDHHGPRCTTFVTDSSCAQCCGGIARALTWIPECPRCRRMSGTGTPVTRTGTSPQCRSFCVSPLPGWTVRKEASHDDLG